MEQPKPRPEAFRQDTAIGDSGMLITNKKRQIGPCIACKMLAPVPESTMRGMIGRRAGDIVNSRLLKNSKHAAAATVLEAYCIDIDTQGIFLIIKLDRSVSTPQFRKAGDHTFVIPEDIYQEVISKAHFE